jgi:hypothetical protein
MYKIEFEFQTKYGVFKDALYLPYDHSFSNDEIQQMKQQRLDNWISVLENPTINQISEVPLITDDIEISGEAYKRLTGVPPTGAKLIEVNGTWYFKVQ